MKKVSKISLHKKSKNADSHTVSKLSRMSDKLVALVAFVMAGILSESSYAQASKGVAAIDDATNSVKQYFEAGINLSYAAAAVIGLIGGVKVYQKWSNGDQDTGKVAGAWIGGAVFLVAAATILRVVFIN
ncbi:DUF4134 domain-containing protein [Xanthocytophaga flava]